MNRRRFLQLGALALASTGMGTLIAGAEPFRCQLRRQHYQIASTPLRGKRVVLLTDIHYGSFFGEEEAEHLTQQVVELKPDMVIFAGDLADQVTTDLEGFFAAWNKVRVPSMFAPGNHDVLQGETDNRVIQQVRAAGVQILINEKETFGDWEIIGMQSGVCGKPNPDLIAKERFSLVISHEPDLWDTYNNGDILQVAGHTHGGQIQAFGNPICLPILGKKYPQGYYSDGKKQLIVSRGVGSTWLNVRIGCPPEIVAIDLV